MALFLDSVRLSNHGTGGTDRDYGVVAPGAATKGLVTGLRIAERIISAKGIENAT